jgi:hypothetical protein
MIPIASVMMKGGMPSTLTPMPLQARPGAPDPVEGKDASQRHHGGDAEVEPADQDHHLLTEGDHHDEAGDEQDRLDLREAAEARPEAARRKDQHDRDQQKHERVADLRIQAELPPSRSVARIGGTRGQRALLDHVPDRPRAASRARKAPITTAMIITTPWKMPV